MFKYHREAAITGSEWCAKGLSLNKNVEFRQGLWYNLLVSLWLFAGVKGGITMRNRPTILRAEKSRAEAIIALFLRPAAARRMELNTVFVMDNRRILTG